MQMYTKTDRKRARQSHRYKDGYKSRLKGYS